MKDLGIRILTFLIGWDWTILKRCTPSSKKVVKKYGSALILIILLWAFIGFNFGKKYFELDITGSIFTALAFSVLIWLVERVIILSGKSILVGIIRGLLAICMAVIGATIVDQILFHKDIEQGKIEYIQDVVNTELDKHLLLIRDKEDKNKVIIDSLEVVNNILQEEVNKKPMIKITNYKQEKVGEDTLGRPIIRNMYSTKDVENPKNQELRRNLETIEQLRLNNNQLFKESQNKEQELKEQYQQNFGLLRELEVVFKVLLKSTISLILYIIISLFFLFIELLIVFTKFFDKHDCDYEILIEKQNSTRITEILQTLDINDESKSLI